MERGCWVLLYRSHGEEQRKRSPRKKTPASSLEIGFEASHTLVQTLPLPFIYQQHDHEKSTGLCASLMSKKGTTQFEAAPCPENVPLTVPKCSRSVLRGRGKGCQLGWDWARAPCWERLGSQTGFQQTELGLGIMAFRQKAAAYPRVTGPSAVLSESG